MIDLHCHILPGLDDGSPSMAESLEMARMAVSEGISTVVATPHHRKGSFINNADEIREAVNRFNAQLLEQGIPLEVRAGQEVHVGSYLLDDWFERKLLTLGGSNCMLIEFPSSRIPATIDETLHELALLKLTPMLAHPERNKEIAEHPDRLYDLVSRGVLCQVTSHSITGRFGPQVQSLALALCSRNLIHVIASDAHNVTDRPFHLQQAYRFIRSKLGQDYVNYYQTNAVHVLEGRQIASWNPVRRKGGVLRFAKLLSMLQPEPSKPS